MMKTLYRWRKFIFRITLLITAIILLFTVISGIIGNLTNKLEQTIREALYPTAYSEYVMRYSEEFSVDPYLVFAVIKCESSFRPEAVSRVGARGLMQIMPDTFDWIADKLNDDTLVYDDMFIPEHNIRYGTYLISVLLEEFGELDNALCAYNAGWGNAKRWLADEKYTEGGDVIVNIPFPETREYVRRVNEALVNYKEIYK
jgi:soluble lytic murein transglycosylase